ncbi:DUF4132 domain-containing protein [Actinomadura sp. CNU-125]|uniref:DUF4132 domain-containing protein n=1 Tax=Actinomadura sp. CNU-125 TaxID=1904961 RepID=UPI0011775980|nr:DUF4132 domain-containing protein [Actinomadura sp. CNU-125]
MLRISTIDDPYGGCEPVFEHLDPGSLAELAWALYVNRDVPDDRWAGPDVQYALRRLGDAGTAARLAREMERWESSFVRSHEGHEAVAVLADMRAGMGPDDAPRLLDRLARTAASDEMRDYAQARLHLVAIMRGLTSEQLSDRLVPADATDPRVLADRIERLEQAMLAGRTWTAAEFRAVLAEHPLLRPVVRRLVWSAGPASFRVAEDGTFADVRGVPFVLPDDARVALPHPIRLDDAEAWAEVFADDAVPQPFEQLARPVHVLTDAEFDSTSLHRFLGVRVPTSRIVDMTARGWSLPEPPHRMVHRRRMQFTTSDGHDVWVTFMPGIHIREPDRYADQEIGAVRLLPRLQQAHWSDVDPVAVSELLAELAELTGSPPQP